MSCPAEGSWQQSGKRQKEFQAPRAEGQAKGPCLPPVGHLQEVAGPSLRGGSAQREVTVWDVDLDSSSWPPRPFSGLEESLKAECYHGHWPALRVSKQDEYPLPPHRSSANKEQGGQPAAAGPWASLRLPLGQVWSGFSIRHGILCAIVPQLAGLHLEGLL